MTTGYHSNEMLLPTLRYAEQIERDELVRFKLRAAASDLELAIVAFAINATGDNLAILVGLWAHAKRCLNQAGGQTHLPRTPLDPAK